MCVRVRVRVYQTYWYPNEAKYREAAKTMSPHPVVCMYVCVRVCVCARVRVCVCVCATYRYPNEVKYREAANAMSPHPVVCVCMCECVRVYTVKTRHAPNWPPVTLATLEILVFPPLHTPADLFF